MSTIKPLSHADIIKFAKKTRVSLVMEDHNVLTGLGAQIARILGDVHPFTVGTIGVPDVFGQSGTEKELLKYFGLS